ncbi:MAG: peptidylprolyl isomerase [Aestuariivita sp.]|nr:peptidylprolyl isomerase [Aestuariivita sp.]
MFRILVALLLSAGSVSATGLEILVKGSHTHGIMRIDLFEDVAPRHVERLTTLASQGAYHNLYFHRVIDGFMAQTGDVQYGKVSEQNLGRAGTGGSEFPDLKAEFSDIPFDRGIMGMARSNDPDSANSQFFIMLSDGYFLNGQYTVVGRIIEGWDVLDNIKRGDASTFKVTGTPDSMVSMTVIE